MHEVVLIGMYFAVFIYVVILHEISHGVMALWLGDRTAQYAGRITLNPKNHIDPWGSVAVPLLMLLVSNFSMAIGWAKPVPYNPYNLKDQKWGPLWVALAGPGTNILLALFAAVLAKIIPLPVLLKHDIQNLTLGSDWSGIAEVVSGSFGAIFYEFCIVVIFWNILLAVFNLIPIPPLDGSKILYAVFPISHEKQIVLEQYGLILLFFVIFFLRGPLGYIIGSAMSVFLGLAV